MQKVNCFVFSFAILAGLLATTQQAKADLSTVTFPEVNGAFYTSGFPIAAVNVQTDLLSLPAGAVISSATLSGIFGQTSQFVGSTAEFDLLINGTQVGSTYDVTPDPFNNVVPFSFSVAPALLSGGSATLSYVQESEYTVRLSETTLAINYSVTSVPEPSTAAICGGTLLIFGLARLIRRRAKSA